MRMVVHRLAPLLLLAALSVTGQGQRITTIQLDGVQYFISRMNPYSPELNYFLAYQYCRSLGLQLASFETREKADSITRYLSNAGYNKYDFWTSGNRLGTDMLIWMSTGLPFNATFDYMRRTGPGGEPVARQLGAVEQKPDSGASDGCVSLMSPDLQWDTQDCTVLKDFICEQTRCYYYNYGSIPVSSSQGGIKGATTTTTTSTSTTEAPQPPQTAVAPQAATEPPDATESQKEVGGETDQATEYSGVTDTADILNSAGNTIRGQKSSQAIGEGGVDSSNENAQWFWARNIMLEKPKKTTAQ